MNKQIKLLWDKLIDDMDEDDIVLEVKILETNIQDYKNLFKSINKSLQYPYNYSLGTENKEFPELIKKSYFNQEKVKEIKIDLGKIILSNGLFEEEEIEFFTNSVINLDYEDAISFFNFIKWLGDSLTKKVDVFIESHPHPSLSYDSINKVFYSYTYVNNI